MNHLSLEDLVASYYGEPAMDRTHLVSCPECQAELSRLTYVLDRVKSPEVPEPGEDYEERVWQRVRWRMRADARRNRFTTWMKWSAVAAVTFMAFCTGLVWRRDATPISHDARVERPAAQPGAAQPVATKPGIAEPASTPAETQVQRDRILLVVVGDHFDRSERVLVELTNLAPNDDNFDIGAERALAEELLTSNRLYRRTALDRGEESVATLLDELEPVLMQIAHAPDDLTAAELRRIQKRVEAKGLVFKLRVVRNEAAATAPNVSQPNV
ncbi:MAG TPA: hypothetical protein VEU30_11565 [Thermoanaerobaculia bacterium]|nr:hypothetical protein [Thermoanaerobaculia bacterium]